MVSVESRGRVRVVVELDTIPLFSIVANESQINFNPNTAEFNGVRIS